MGTAFLVLGVWLCFSVVTFWLFVRTAANFSSAWDNEDFWSGVMLAALGPIGLLMVFFAGVATNQNPPPLWSERLFQYYKETQKRRKELKNE